MKVAGIAVAAVVVAADREGDGVADRAGDVALDDDRVIIAIARLERAAEVELRLLRDDADDAGRGLLAEPGCLRAAQPPVPPDVRQVPVMGGRARGATDQAGGLQGER